MVLYSSTKYLVLHTEACYEEMAKVRDTIEKEMTLGDIANIAIGPWGHKIVNIALVITQSGFCIAYFIFMGNTIAEMFPVTYKDLTLHPMKNSTFSNENIMDMGKPFMDSLIEISTAQPVPAGFINSSILVPPLKKISEAPGFLLLVLIPFPFLVLMAYVRSIRKLGPISGVANVTILVGFLGLLVYLLHGKT